MILRRNVAPRALPKRGSASVPAARSRLCAIAERNTQAEFAPNRPEGMWASGPSIESANTVSMTAWRRWVISASTVDSVVSVKNG